MFRRWSLSLLLAAPIFLASVARLPAQEDISIGVQTRISVKDMKESRKPLKDPDPAKAKKNQEDIEATAYYTVMRLTDDVNRGLKSGKTPVPMSKIVQEAAELILEAPYPPKKYDEKQLVYLEAWGKAIMPHLRHVLTAEKDKPLKYDYQVRVNAARILSLVGKSGYEDSATLALDVLAHPKESDAVKLFALQALKNLFAACSPDNPEKSTFTKADLEKRAIRALIDFVERPLTIPKDSPESELEAFHYVRREAIRALGNVRYPIIRKGKTVEMSPAVVLLRFAVGAPAIQPPPKTSERAEALVGYLQLSPDPERQQQMDYAGFYVANAIRLLIADFNTRKELPPIGTPPVAGAPPITPANVDYYGWKLAASKLVELLKAWKEKWEINSPQPPPTVKKIMDEVTQQGIDNLLMPLTATTLPKGSISLTDFDTFIQNQQKSITATTLFKDDPKSIVWLAPAAAPAPPMP